jgi:hypothetical protein
MVMIWCLAFAALMSDYVNEQLRCFSKTLFKMAVATGVPTT